MQTSLTHSQQQEHGWRPEDFLASHNDDRWFLTRREKACIAEREEMGARE
jgi:hypothetical protein